LSAALFFLRGGRALRAKIAPDFADPSTNTKIFNDFGRNSWCFHAAAPIIRGSQPVHARHRDIGMKITVNIDCTPAEARSFMGLPDFEPMQKRAMEELEKRMLESLDRYTPEALLKSWLQPGSMNTDWFRDLLRQANKT
jgi:hypothetical protein